MESVGCAAIKLEPADAKMLFDKIGYELYPTSVGFQNKSFKLLKAGYNSRRISAGKSLIP
jgi:hypothetical protein